MPLWHLQRLASELCFKVTLKVIVSFVHFFFTSCFCSGPPLPGSCQAQGLWCLEIFQRWARSCLPHERSGACGMGRALAGSSQTSPSLHQHAPSHVYYAASEETEKKSLEIHISRLVGWLSLHPNIYCTLCKYVKVDTLKASFFLSVVRWYWLDKHFCARWLVFIKRWDACRV